MDAMGAGMMLLRREIDSMQKSDVELRFQVSGFRFQQASEASSRGTQIGAALAPSMRGLLMAVWGYSAQGFNG